MFLAHQYFDFFLYSYDFNLIHLFFLPGIIMFDRYPSVYPFGESIVSFECEYRWLLSERETKNASLEIQLRRNANDNWTTVVELNRSSVFRKSENTFFNFTILSVSGRRYVTLTGLIQSKQCTVDRSKDISRPSLCSKWWESNNRQFWDGNIIDWRYLVVVACILQHLNNKCMYIFIKNHNDWWQEKKCI